MQRTLLTAIFLLWSAALPAPHVSVYYYPWYSGANWNQSNFLRGKNRMDIPPLIGTYDNVVNKVTVKQHVEWSTNFGIDSWICSWWGPDSYQSKAILNNVAPNLVGTKVTFSLFYETSAFYNGKWTFGPAEVQLFYDHFKFMNDNFFSHPNYRKIGGKPMVVVYLSRMMNGDYATALARVRKDFNVYLVGDDFHFGPPDPARHRNWDAITIYNVHGIKTFDGYPQATGFVEGSRKNFQNHKKAIAPNGTGFMSNVIPGYNDRAVRLENNNYPIPRRVHADSAEGSTFRQMLAMGLEEGDTVLGTAICSWNEWWEDTEIEPTIISPPTNKDGTADFAYSKGYQYEGYGPALLQMILAMAGRNAEIAPALTLLEPNLQSGWTAGSQRTITWRHAGIIYYVNLDYWNGSSWVRIATQIENSGSYTWTVPATGALPVKIRVSTVEGVTYSTSGSTAISTRDGLLPMAPGIRVQGRTLLFHDLDRVLEISIADLSGRVIESIPVQAKSLSWSAKSAGGAALAPGVYRVHFRGSQKSRAMRLVLAR